MGCVALVLGAMSGWVAWQWWPASIPSALFVFSALFLFWIGAHSPIEVTDREITVGRHSVAWSSITRIETTGWLTPLVLRLTMDSGKRLHVVYAGDLESSGRLKEIVCQCAPHALLDGQPQRQRQATIAVRNGRTEKLEKYPLLTAKDEAEVERMFQRLREVGHLDPQRSAPNSSPEDQ